LQCVVDASWQIPPAWNANYVAMSATKADGDAKLKEASAYAASTPGDPDIASLQTAITGYQQAQQLYNTVSPFMENPPQILVGEIDTVRSKIIQKISPTAVTMADQETAINKYVAAAQGAATGTAANQTTGSVAVPPQHTTLSRYHLSLVGAATPTAKDYAGMLKGDAQAILDPGQLYSTIQTNIAGCIAKMPS
jgi:hypothetical protein